MKTLTRIVPYDIYGRILFGILRYKIVSYPSLRRGFTIYVTKEGILDSSGDCLAYTKDIRERSLWTIDADIERVLYSLNAAAYKIRIIPSNNFIKFHKTKL